MVLKEIGCKDVDWISVSQNRQYRRDLMNMVI